MSDPDKWYRSTVPELQVGAEAGDPDAMYHLALRYRKGREVPQDIPYAVEWLLRAADLGHAHAQSSMGVRYYYGEGVPKNHRLAMKWYLSGAAKKEPEALYNVGDLFDDSDEITKASAIDKINSREALAVIAYSTVWVSAVSQGRIQEQTLEPPAEVQLELQHTFDSIINQADKGELSAIIND